ncbi:hypothetical protein DFH07DRAFT_791973 [Mycena maculata]|uniref:Secreted protein n=1 Tax=Mycena maculata TaxID=230809 RepID=A0AAD7KF72_9AGAR|nr:hypothetical protein DFH07DRAFT_791973 [Mycena maculata]
MAAATPGFFFLLFFRFLLPHSFELGRTRHRIPRSSRTTPIPEEIGTREWVPSNFPTQLQVGMTTHRTVGSGREYSDETFQGKRGVRPGLFDQAH